MTILQTIQSWFFDTCPIHGNHYEYWGYGEKMVCPNCWEEENKKKKQ